MNNEDRLYSWEEKDLCWWRHKTLIIRNAINFDTWKLNISSWYTENTINSKNKGPGWVFSLVVKTPASSYTRSIWVQYSVQDSNSSFLRRQTRQGGDSSSSWVLVLHTHSVWTEFSAPALALTQPQKMHAFGEWSFLEMYFQNLHATKIVAMFLWVGFVGLGLSSWLFRYTPLINIMSYHNFCPLSYWLILKSLRDSLGKNRLRLQPSLWVCWAGASSTLLHPLAPSVFYLLEPGKSLLCWWSLHLFPFSVLLQIHTFLSVNSSPCHFTGSWTQEETDTWI